jgi:hypothetical protein
MVLSPSPPGPTPEAKKPTIVPECKTARKWDDVRRQDVFACPVELSGESHDCAIPAEADIVSAVRPKISAAWIQSDDDIARTYHMSVAVKRENPIRSAVDIEQSIDPVDPKATRIDDARIVAEIANRLTVVGKGENFSIACAVGASCACDEERHRFSHTRRISAIQRAFHAQHRSFLQSR